MGDLSGAPVLAAGVGAAFDQVGGDGAVLGFAGEEAVAGLRAEMRQVDRGHAVCRGEAQEMAGRHCGQRLARLEDGQGAEQPFAIERDIGDAGHVGVIVRGQGHGNVTKRYDDGGGGSG